MAKATCTKSILIHQTWILMVFLPWYVFHKCKCQNYSTSAKRQKSWRQLSLLLFFKFEGVHFLVN